MHGVLHTRWRGVVVVYWRRAAQETAYDRCIRVHDRNKTVGLLRIVARPPPTTKLTDKRATTIPVHKYLGIDLN